MSYSEEEYLREKQKLKKTRQYIETEIKESEERLERGFEDYDFDDYADDYMKTALKDKFTQRIKNLQKVKDKPYFARVDFVEDGPTNREAFYFGKTFVTDHETLEQVVVDWRAPIACISAFPFSLINPAIAPATEFGFDFVEIFKISILCLLKYII